MTSRPLSTRGQMAILLALSLVSALGAWRLHKAPLPLVQAWDRYVEEEAAKHGLPTIGLEEARRLVEAQTHLALDARRHADYAAGHLPGAFALPEADIDRYLPQVLPLLTPEQPILVYCSGAACDESIRLGTHLRANGFTNVVLFTGGYQAWTDAGLPVEKGG